MVCSSLFDNARHSFHRPENKIAPGTSTVSGRFKRFDSYFGLAFSLLTQTERLAPALALNLFVASTALAEDAGNLYNTPFDINAGRSYFEKQCSRCHGFDARGNDEVGAPNLTGKLTRASSSAGIYTILREGISGTAMMAGC